MRCVVLVCLLIGNIILLSAPNTVLAAKNAINLLSNAGWASYMGATPVREGFQILPLDREITHQDGSLPQPNPPINLFGPRLSVTGNFKLSATMRDIDEWASLRLYGEVPIVYDQWRYERGSIEIRVATSSVKVQIWDGSSSNSNDIRTYAVNIKSETKISLEKKNNTFIIGVDGKTLGTMPTHEIFSSERMWIGTDAAPGTNGWILTKLSISTQNKKNISVIPTPQFIETKTDQHALRNLAANRPRSVAIGTALSIEPLLVDDDFRKIAVGEFNMWTPENSLKPQFVHPAQDVYAFKDIDTYIDIAAQNNVAIHGHSLVYHKSNPIWMNETPTHERGKIMVDHITAVVGHFKGRIAQWDVVNEPLSNERTAYKDDRKGLDSTLWYEAMGEYYIDIAFHAARKADPNAKLYLNDYGLERDGERWDALIALIKRLQSRGVPIDGIGFESHIYGDGDYSDAETLKRHMDELAALGLLVRISEIDVTGDDPGAQIEQYLIALDVCLRSPNCTAFSTWGITDRYGSTTRTDRYPLIYGTSLLWDSNLKPKPSVYMLKQRLQQ